MPIKLGSVAVNPPGINSVYWGSQLVYLAGELFTVSGISPLAFVNALAKPIKKLTQYGKCTLNGSPTAAAPADIVCNNGTLGFVNDDIPEEYVRLEYLESTGTQYIDSGVKINYAQAKNEQIVTVQYTKSNSTRELMGSNGYGFWGKSASNKFEAPLGNTVTVTESALSKSIVSLMTNPSTNSVVFNVNGKSYTASASTFADNYYSVYIFALGGREGAAASFYCNARVYDYIIKIDDRILAHLLPVKRRSDGVLGMYDIVTNTFKTNAGTGTFVAGKPAGSVATINDVPGEYIELEYLESSGTQYIDTGIVPSLDITAEADYFGGANYAAYGARWSGTPNNDTFGIYRSGYTDSGGARIIAYYGRYGNGEYGNFIVNSAPRFRTYIGTDSATVNEVTLPISRESMSTNLTMYLFAMNKDNEAAFGGMVRIYSLKFFRNGQAIADYIPCKRRSDGTLGMYDAVTNTFKTNDGTGTFVAGPAVDHIGVIGTPEVLTVSCKNLVNITSNDIEQGAISSSNGENSSSTYRARTIGFVPVKPSTQYTVSCVINGYTPGGSRGVFLLEYSTNEDGGFTGISSSWKTPDGYTFTTGATTNYIRIVFAKGNNTSYQIDPEDVSKVQLEYGDVATSYQPYIAPQFAFVQDLFAVGDIKDEQDIISGVVTRRCAMCLYDGTQNVGDVYLSTTGGKDIGAIIIYPLAEPVTEHVTPQPLNTVTGTNVIKVTSDIGAVDLEATAWFPPIPSAYTRLHYIQGTGPQYIDSGISLPDLTNEYRIKYRMTIDGWTAGSNIGNIGYQGTNGALLLSLRGADDVIYIGPANSTLELISNHIYTIEHVRGSDASRITIIDGEVFNSAVQSSIKQETFGIFKLAPFTTEFNAMYGKLYDFQVFKNGTMIANFIPCMRKSDSEIGVYDMVSKRFITNAGSGSFLGA